MVNSGLKIEQIKFDEKLQKYKRENRKIALTKIGDSYPLKHAINSDSLKYSD